MPLRQLADGGNHFGMIRRHIKFLRRIFAQMKEQWRIVPLRLLTHILGLRHEMQLELAQANRMKLFTMVIKHLLAR